jgi:hypothetical protein
MTTLEVESLTTTANAAVIRLPGRKLDERA